MVSLIRDPFAEEQGSLDLLRCCGGGKKMEAVISSAV
jgi:hypothetical protein